MSLDKKDYLTFLIGLLGVVRIQVIGTFLLSEFILFILYLFSTKNPWKIGYIKKMYICGLLWLFGAVISNLVNEINIIDFAKGVFFILVLILLVRPIFWLLSDKPERLLLFTLGSSISVLLTPYFAQNEIQAAAWSSDVFRYYYYYAMVSGLGYFLYFKGKRIIAISIIEIASFIGLFNNSRNAFLISTLASILLLQIEKIRHKNFSKSIVFFRKNIPKTMIVLGIGALFIYITYDSLASQGILGDAAYEKYVIQKERGNLMKSGRMVTFMGVELILRKPIVGWGSYAKDTWGFADEYFTEQDIEYNASDYDEKGLPSHSYIVGAWMQNGILGGLFWIYIIMVVWKIWKCGCLLYETRLLGLLIFLICGFLWDWAFSPFGNRVNFLFFFLTLVVVHNNYKMGLYPYSEKRIKRLSI